MKTKEEILATSCQLIKELEAIQGKFQALIDDCPKDEEWAELFTLYTHDITIKSLSAVVRRHDGILSRYITPEGTNNCPTGEAE